MYHTGCIVLCFVALQWSRKLVGKFSDFGTAIFLVDKKIVLVSVDSFKEV